MLTAEFSPLNKTLKGQQVHTTLATVFPRFIGTALVTGNSYHVALLRLRGAVHGDAIGWRCQLRRVRLDEATSVNETSQRERDKERRAVNDLSSHIFNTETQMRP